MRVCVLGARIVGLSSAYELTRAGHNVTVIDRATPGNGASGGNGSQLSYNYAQPLADPGIWRNCYSCCCRRHYRSKFARNLMSIIGAGACSSWLTVTLPHRAAGP